MGRHQQKAFVMTLSLFCVYNILGQGKSVLRLRELPNTHCVALSGKRSWTQISVNSAHSTGVNNKTDSLLMLNNFFYRFIKEHA